MPLTLLIGGARSGKSELAVRTAKRHHDSVVVIVTGEARDPEMARRIAHHRRARPRAWEVVEERVDLARALEVAPGDGCVLIDCLTLWVSNLMEDGLTDAAIEERARGALEVVTDRPGPTIAVTNEVGSGIVPARPRARRYRDLLGRVNATWAGAADQPLLVAAGLVVPLVRPEETLGG
jgi:adenosylcobinamide kinase/adenosylcobinamide-phosphate guanylyltransferase